MSWLPRSSDSAPLISAILRLVLIGKLPKSSFSALMEPNTKSFLLRLVLFFGLIQTVLPQFSALFLLAQKERCPRTWCTTLALFLVNINMPKMSCYVNILEKIPKMFCVTNQY